MSCAEASMPNLGEGSATMTVTVRRIGWFWRTFGRARRTSAACRANMQTQARRRYCVLGGGKKGTGKGHKGKVTDGAGEGTTTWSGKG